MATPPSAVDDEIAALSLQLEDLSYLSPDGEELSDQHNDFDEASATYRAELQQRLNVLQDRKHAQSIARAVFADSPEIARLLIQDRQAREDWNVALQMGGLPLAIENTPQDNGQDDINQALVHFEANAAQEDEAAPPQPLVGLLEWNPDGLKTCHTCFDQYSAAETFQLCEHVYCIGCLKELFVRTTTDQTLYPPHCCTSNFDLALIAPHMSAEEVTAYQEAAVEWTTANRVYCSNQRCGKFVPPSQYQALSNHADCEKCGTNTCIHCKRSTHIGECVEDPAMRETLALAR